VDVLKACRSFYAGIGLPIDRILERSDLYEKPGKVAHAFCFVIDREGDIRVLANIKPNDYWTGTMLHELGHAVYDDGIDRRLPYALRMPSHTLTTEGIAMMFGRLSKHGGWMRQGAGVPEATAQGGAAAAARTLRAEALVFSRWCQVMLHFERGMYRDPEQDLGKLWWDLVERYQGLRRPGGRNEPDYASKIHIVSAPVYYHNYEMGDLFASQVHRAMVKAIHGDKDPKGVVYVGDQRVGKFLRERVFAPGARLSWNELTRFATGESLSPRGFAADFLQ
jgi:peptidyl-dipeptidase A